MEEVWNDINLASLSESTNPNPNRSSSSLLHINLPHAPRHHHHHHHPNFRNMTLQDFLARPFGNEPPYLLPSSSPDTALHNPASPLPPPPPATTLLTLNNPHAEFQIFYLPDPLIRPPNSEFQLDHHQNPNQHHDLHHLQSNPNNISSSVSSSFSGCPFESLAASSSGLPSFGKRSFPDSDHSNSGDRRHKRMIKNRESAARSRARKQAYTNELELEVAHLMEENAKLRRQQEQVSYAAASQQPKRHNFHRSSTAPF